MVCCEDGSSQWITGSEARENSHRTLRALSQAILVGVGTVLADDCSLTVRGVEGAEKQPLRVVLDPRGRIMRTAKILRTEEAPTLIVVGPGADKTGLEGVEVLEVEVDENGGLDLTAVLKDLAGRGIFQVLVEGGAKTLTNFIENQLVDELVVYYGPVLLGQGGSPFYLSPSPSTISEAQPWRLHCVQRIADDLRCEYRKMEC
ncbi:hypothetical protein FOZ63_023652 [Perkinsus olseni]|nr:hypothetical protein FOZ63_023652 [Perkinsus olseni]